MRVIIKANHITTGGGLTHYNKIAEQFARLRPDMEFIALAKVSQQELFDADLPNFNYHFHAVPDKNKIAQAIWEKRELPGIVNDLKGDMLYVPGIYHTTRLQLPVVTVVHNIAPFSKRYIAEESLYQKARLLALKQATINSLKQSDGVIFLSRYCQRYFAQFYDNNKIPSLVAYHGAPDKSTVVDDNMVLNRLGIKKPYLLSVSHVYRYKKIKEMVQAYAIANEQNELPPLIIAGELYDPGYSEEITRLAKKYNCAAKVSFVGNVDESSLPVLYRNCRTFLFPSSLETCSVILIEALAAGCPIISSNKTVMPEVSGYRMRYVNPTNVESFARLITEVVTSQTARERLSQAALERSGFFSWEKSANNMLSFFDSIIHKNKTPQSEGLVSDTKDISYV